MIFSIFILVRLCDYLWGYHKSSSLRSLLMGCVRTLTFLTAIFVEDSESGK